MVRSPRQQPIEIREEGKIVSEGRCISWKKITSVLSVIIKSTWLNTVRDFLQILEKFGNS